jgi:hypothetical protein
MSTSISNFPNGFAAGVSIRGVPLALTHTGKTFYVNNATGQGRNPGNGNKGTLDSPLATIDNAVGRCVANRGDIIFVGPGHVETVTAAGGLDLDVAGIAVIGLGSGSLRPQVNFTTVVGADMDIDAANITIANMLFTGGVDALTGPIDVNAADCRLINIETRDVTGQATDFIVTDDNCDRLIISGWKHLGAAAAGADTAISLVGGDDWIIEDFDIYGTFAVAGIENVTTASNRVRIGGGARWSYIWTENAADIAITMVAASTGFIGPNINVMLQDNAANVTECIVGAAMQFMLPINVCNLAGEASMVFNATATTDA